MTRRQALLRELGQTTAEFLGVTLVLAAVVGVIATSGVGGQIADGVKEQVCRVLNDDTECEDSSPRERAKAKDQDRDGVSDRDERARGTLPGDADSDSDGLSDGDERKHGTDPREADSDDDGLDDGREVRAEGPRGEPFDPLKADQDRDGLTDAQELAAGTPPNDADADIDGQGGRTDGLTDRQEILRHGTDPTVIDTDGDGDSDGDEVASDSNPLVDERSLGEKAAPIGEDLLLGDLPTPAAVGTALKKLPGLGGALKKLIGSSDEAAAALRKNAEEAVERKRQVQAAAPPRARGRGPDDAFHYTRGRFAQSIEKEGLRPGAYVTSRGDLKPMQAQLDLALPPNRGLPDAVIRVDLAGLRKAGFDIGDFTRVGRKFNMPGGGTELRLEKAIPPRFLEVVRR